MYVCTVHKVWARKRLNYKQDKIQSLVENFTNKLLRNDKSSQTFFNERTN